MDGVRPTLWMCKRLIGKFIKWHVESTTIQWILTTQTIDFNKGKWHYPAYQLLFAELQQMPTIATNVEVQHASTGTSYESSDIDKTIGTMFQVVMDNIKMEDLDVHFILHWEKKFDGFVGG